MWVIISADADGPGYHAEMVPLCCSSWRKFMPETKIALVIIGDDTENTYRAKYGQWCDAMEIVRPSAKYSKSIVARTSRLWYGATMRGEVVTFEDVDLILCQREWHVGKFAQWKPGRVMRMGAEYYKTIVHESGKAPMSKFTCEADVLRSFVNPSDLPFHEWIAQFDGVNLIDMHGRENVAQSGNFSDESLLRALMFKWNHWELVDDIARDWGYDDCYILNRARWGKVNWEWVRQGAMYEGHILKPYYDNLITVSASVAANQGLRADHPGLKPLIEYIGYDEPALGGAACA